MSIVFCLFLPIKLCGIMKLSINEIEEANMSKKSFVM